MRTRLRALFWLSNLATKALGRLGHITIQSFILTLGVHQHVKANASILSSVTTTLSRLAPTTPADGVTAPQPLTGITTMVVTGSSGAAPAAYVSGQTPTFNVSSTAAKRIMMNYNTLPAPTTTVVYNHQSPMALPSVGTTAHLSASSILADSKKQHQLLQHQPATQLAAAAIIQQQPQSAAAAAGNVFVVHRSEFSTSN